MTASETPLSDKELERLDALLSSEAEDTLSIDEAHGYLTALIVRHSTTSQETWLEAILGDIKTPAECSDMLIRMHNDIAAALNSHVRFEPMIIEEEIDGELFESYEGWCFGFMLGVTQEQEQWEQLPSNKEELLAPIAQLALLYSDDEMDMDEEEYVDCIELIPGAVTELYSYWQQ